MRLLKSALIGVTLVASLLIPVGVGAQTRTMDNPVQVPQVEAPTPQPPEDDHDRPPAPPPSDVKEAVVTPAFRIDLTPGAVWYCVVFQQQTLIPPDVNWPDGHYTPRKCSDLHESDEWFYEDWIYIVPEGTEWLVWAEIGYPGGVDADGSFVVNYIQSPKVRAVW